MLLNGRKPFGLGVELPLRAPGLTERRTPRLSACSTYSTQGRIDTKGAFFQSLGTNGRTCATCHVFSEGMGLSAAGARERFAATNGKDPLFAPVDGANCPNARAGSAADRSLLPKNGLIRIPLTLPANAQFTISPRTRSVWLRDRARPQWPAHGVRLPAPLADDQSIFFASEPSRSVTESTRRLSKPSEPGLDNPDPCL